MRTGRAVRGVRGPGAAARRRSAGPRHMRERAIVALPPVFFAPLGEATVVPQSPPSTPPRTPHGWTAHVLAATAGAAGAGRAGGTAAGSFRFLRPATPPAVTNPHTRLCRDRTA